MAGGILGGGGTSSVALASLDLECLKDNNGKCREC